jgi:hypothetical protein
VYMLNASSSSPVKDTNDLMKGVHSTSDSWVSNFIFQ